MLPQIQLGRRSGLFVSPLCLGTMNFGEPGRGHQGDWTLGLDDAREIFRTALDLGVFFFDCADIYGLGASEEVVGQLLRELAPRQEYVLATKIGAPWGPHRNVGGLSRKRILEGVDASLRRLRHDHIDLLILHRHPHAFPGYEGAPIEETLEALNDVVRAGKVLYLGASSMFAWQFAELQLTARARGWTPFVAMQNHYNLVYREEEREMLPYCRADGVAVTPWSPLARGILAGAYQGGFRGGATSRSRGRDRVRTEGLYRGEAVFEIAGRVREIADRLDATPAQVALAWVMSRPGVTAPVVGVSSSEQLRSLVGAADLTLSPGDVAHLEAPYRPLENLLSLGTS